MTDRLKPEFNDYVRERAGHAGVLLVEGALEQFSSAVQEAGTVFLQKTRGLPHTALAVGMQAVLANYMQAAIVIDRPSERLVHERIAMLVRFLQGEKL